MNRNHTGTIKLTALLVILAVAILGGIGAVYSAKAEPTNIWAYKPPVAAKPAAKPVLPPTPVVTYRHDPEVVAIMDRLGLDYSKLNLVYGDSANQTAITQGLYSSSLNTIYLSPNADSTIIDRILSHEYIHYVQAVHVDEAKEYYLYTLGLMNSDAGLHQRMARYISNEACTNQCNLSHESEAIACTEQIATPLSDHFTAFCNKYLPKRSLLFN